MIFFFRVYIQNSSREQVGSGQSGVRHAETVAVAQGGVFDHGSVGGALAKSFGYCGLTVASDNREALLQRAQRTNGGRRVRR